MKYFNNSYNFIYLQLNRFNNVRIWLIISLILNVFFLYYLVLSNVIVFEPIEELISELDYEESYIFNNNNIRYIKTKSCIFDPFINLFNKSNYYPSCFNNDYPLVFNYDERNLCEVILHNQFNILCYNYNDWIELLNDLAKVYKEYNNVIEVILNSY